jgi:hypothetical protein
LLSSFSRCGAAQVTISIDIFNDKGELVDHSEQRNVRRDDLPLLLGHDADVARQEG